MKEEEDRIDKWFDSLTEASLNYDREFDSKITYIGAGAIALSIAFATDADLSYLCQRYFIAGEIGMTAGVVLNLISFPLSKILARHYYNIVSDYRKNGCKGDLKPNIDIQEKRMYRSILYYNLFCLLFFVAGVVCTCIYVFNNL